MVTVFNYRLNLELRIPKIYYVKIVIYIHVDETQYF